MLCQGKCTACNDTSQAVDTTGNSLHINGTSLQKTTRHIYARRGIASPAALPPLILQRIRMGARERVQFSERGISSLLTRHASGDEKR